MSLTFPLEALLPSAADLHTLVCPQWGEVCSSLIFLSWLCIPHKPICLCHQLLLLLLIGLFSWGTNGNNGSFPYKRCRQSAAIGFMFFIIPSLLSFGIQKDVSIFRLECTHIAVLSKPVRYPKWWRCSGSMHSCQGPSERKCMKFEMEWQMVGCLEKKKFLQGMLCDTVCD